VYDFLKAFPGLAAAFKQGVLESEAHLLFEALKSVIHDHAFVGGGPGSGKTTVALKIVKAIVSGIVNPKDGRVEPDPPCRCCQCPR
jgi:ABC-type transport system involved in cytochrome c biogenesis ATPase subunit